tara:strand:+ start:220 stop:1206 length:987 start_codon:yes stop_codon:yes gene_type:complete
MAWKRFNNKKTDTSLPVGFATWPRINSLVNKRITEQQYDFYEAEALEVKSVNLNGIRHRGSVTGVFLNSKIEVIDVRPLKANITVIPVVGEHVVGVQYQGQYYYTDIINRTGKVNENSMPGASGVYDKDTKFGKTFQSKEVKSIQVGEGSIVFEGRFGQALHFDGDNNTPKIKISTHVDESDGFFRNESIDSDDTSLYLLSSGMSDLFDGQQISGKKVLIKSNGIFISGDDVRLGSSVDTEIEPVVLGNKLKELLDEVFTGTIAQNNTTIATNTAKIATLVALNPQTPQSVQEMKSLSEQNVELGKVNVKLQTSIETATYLSSIVKTA